MAGHSFEDELKPDAEANRIISDSDLINIDIKELNKMLKERGIAKVNRLIYEGNTECKIVYFRSFL